MNRTAPRPHLFDRGLHVCPGCSSERLRTVAIDDEVNFHCDQCGCDWHVAMNHVTRVRSRAVRNSVSDGTKDSGDSGSDSAL